jgi:hypothetical protein
VIAGAFSGSACAHAPRDRTTAIVAPAGSIAWAAWDKASFAQAKHENRLILVNVVATWCHWCHVMEDTTYEDPEVRELLRRHFVTIRVDSDARPDVAERYRDWGWPATGVLSPDAMPVVELRGYQQPRAFAKLLRGLVADRDRGQLAHREIAAPKAAAKDVALDAIRVRTAARLDHFYQADTGAWSKQQRYPAPGPIEHALVRAMIDDDAASAKQATTTLGSALALIDPVFGGMYQYSTDGDWQHPHFEKITAIQAGAIRNYALAYRFDGDVRWLRAAKDVARFMTTMMHDAERGFATSQDADLRVPGKPAVLGADYYAKDEVGRRALGVPRIDDAAYADLNGMMIEALCDLYAASGEREYLDIALATARTIVRTHGTKAGAFRHAATDTGLVYLRDQIAMGRAMLALARTSGDASWLDHAERTAAFMLASLQDDAGGFFAHTADPDAVGVFAQRRKPLEENGTAARFLAALHRHRDGDGGGETPYLAAAERALRSLGDTQTIEAEGQIIGHYLLGLREVTMPTVDVTVVGDLGKGDVTAALHAAALRLAEPRAILEVSRPGDRYPDIGKPAVYLCTEAACSTPITKPEKLGELADAFIRTSLPRP